MRSQWRSMTFPCMNVCIHTAPLAQIHAPAKRGGGGAAPPHPQSPQRQKKNPVSTLPPKKGPRHAAPWLRPRPRGARSSTNNTCSYTLDPAAMAFSAVMAAALAESQTTNFSSLGRNSTQPHGGPSGASRPFRPASYIKEAPGGAPMAAADQLVGLGCYPSKI